MEFVFFGASVLLFGLERLEGSHRETEMWVEVWRWECLGRDDCTVYFGGAKDIKGRLVSQPRASAAPHIWPFGYLGRSGLCRFTSSL